MFWHTKGMRRWVDCAAGIRCRGSGGPPARPAGGAGGGARPHPCPLAKERWQRRFHAFIQRRTRSSCKRLRVARGLPVAVLPGAHQELADDRWLLAACDTRSTTLHPYTILIPFREILTLSK